MSLRLLAALAVAALGGVFAHELAHWLVWRLSGRRPLLDCWRLEVRPQAGPARTTPLDRVAAAAPYAGGLAALCAGVLGGRVLLVVFGVAMVQLPSRADVRTLLGRTVWALE
jgi:hypothetical protein